MRLELSDTKVHESQICARHRNGCSSCRWLPADKHRPPVWRHGASRLSPSWVQLATDQLEAPTPRGSCRRHLLLLLCYSRPGPRRALRLELSDAKVHEPAIHARHRNGFSLPRAARRLARGINAKSELPPPKDCPATPLQVYGTAGAWDPAGYRYPRTAAGWQRPPVWRQGASGGVLFFFCIALDKVLQGPCA